MAAGLLAEQRKPLVLASSSLKAPKKHLAYSTRCCCQLATTLDLLKSKSGPSLWSQLPPKEASCIFPKLSGLWCCRMVPQEKGDWAALRRGSPGPEEYRGGGKGGGKGKERKN